MTCDKNCWFWKEFFFSYNEFIFKKQELYENNYYFTKFNHRFFYMHNFKKNSMLLNSNNASNIAIQGKINFFDLNDNVYCLNSYYLQNFDKIKQTIYKKQKKKLI